MQALPRNTILFFDYNQGPIKRVVCAEAISLRYLPPLKGPSYFLTLSLSIAISDPLSV